MSEMLKAATDGFHSRGATNPYLWSSPLWFAFDAGVHMQKHSSHGPARAKMSRGYCVKLDNGQGVFVVKYSGPELGRVEISWANKF